MGLILIGFVALVASGLTFFSGFGLGTILMPVFVLFFPVPLAISATAVVHFANNIFRFCIMAKYTDWGIVARFSIPAAIAAMIGAAILYRIDQFPSLISYNIGDSQHQVTIIKIVIGVLIVVFSLLELSKSFQQTITLRIELYLKTGAIEISNFKIKRNDGFDSERQITMNTPVVNYKNNAKTKTFKDLVFIYRIIGTSAINQKSNITRIDCNCKPF